jgi:DNA mismatch repair ATPase MutS
MAGMPTELVERAEELAQSSEGKPSSLATVFPSSGSSAQLSLFDTNDGQSNVGYVKKQVKQLADQLKVEKARSESMHRELAAVKPLVDAVRSLPISTTTPLKALQLIAELQEAYGS